MTVLLGVHEAYLHHDAGRGHPESPDRLRAAVRGARDAGLGDRLVTFVPRRASDEEIERVHATTYRDALEKFCGEGGGHLDPDTVAVAASYEAAVLAAGAGPDAVERLRAQQANAAFLAVRPPGHHALSERAMGFCLFNNIAITAAMLVSQGERVLIVDFDAHHGNGTQAAFYAEPNVLYVSFHQHPLYPGTGALGEVGIGEATGLNINFPFPAGTTGDAYELAFDEVICPAAEVFSATWVLASAGYDAHRDDPLTDLGLVSGDFSAITQRLMDLSLPGRRIFFLEGGYDLAGLEQSVKATVRRLDSGEHDPDPVSGSGEDGLRGVNGEAERVVLDARLLQERLHD